MISCRLISDLSCIRCPYWGIFSVSDEIYGLSWRSHVRWWMISWHLFFGPVAHLMPYWGIFRFGGSLWIFAEVTCSRIDDSMLSDLRPIIHFDAIQGHISVRMRFTDHEGVACLSLFGEMYAEMMMYSLSSRWFLSGAYREPSSQAWMT